MNRASGPSAPRTSAPLRALALAGALALVVACTPPQGESASDDATTPEPTGSSSSPTPSPSDPGDPGEVTRPTDEPQGGDETEGGADGEESVEYVRGLPAGVEDAPEETAGGVGWTEAGDALYVITLGSSSCPLVPGQVETSGSGVEITLSAAGGAVCTADVVPTYAEVPAPAGLSSDAPVTATLGDLGQVTVPAAATPPAIGWIPVGG
ncbi:hypothetical protein [Litorihabitans aurantiacus]|uniref:Uncharacterized protein n=1 Tax=Litorihabitans aurantiacus TaxID=1930061 RepID=A0AA37XG65_9MICO|nr:hypothetical protein [Litorihabitans aurantiacus]GMA32508.1 hypothetical protein GCM10025875_25000 [Litorihabitans aurantiacus]